MTRRPARGIVADATVMPIRWVARCHKIGWHKVNALVGAWAAVVAERRRSRACRVLLVDETSMRKRHRYVAVIVNADTGRTLAMVPHRSTAALSGFFASQGRKWCKQVKVVVAGGSPAYRAAVAAHLGHTCWTGSTSSDGSPPGSPRCAETCSAADPSPQGAPSTRRCSKPASLSCGEPAPSPTRTGPASTRSSTPTPASKPPGRPSKNSGDSTTPTTTKAPCKPFDRFRDLYETGELPEFHDIVNTFIEWSDEILNWHHTERPPNGRIQGTNNLLQTLRRTACGFTNPHNFQARGLLIT